MSGEGLHFWLRVFSDLIPFFISAALWLAGAYSPFITKSDKRLAVYLVGVLIFSFVVHWLWVGGAV